jgi:hypothetical protein
MDRKIVILSSGQVVDHVLNSKYETIRSRPSPFLLELISDGYRVIVITSRRDWTNWDQCWMSLLPREDIHFTERHPFDICDANAPEYVVPWRKVFDELGLTHPAKTRSWIFWRDEAAMQGFVLNARSQRKKAA